MAKFCTTKTCKFHLEKKEFQDHVSNCKGCGKVLGATLEGEPEETAQQRFVALLETVKKKFQKTNKHHAGYVLPMLDHLASCSAYFKDDFVRELFSASADDKLNAINLAKLVDPANERAQDFSTSCVDQAFDALKGKVKLPAEYPAGEKFDFELPYLMKEKWTFVNTGANAPFTQTVKELVGASKAGQCFFVIYKFPASASIGHAVFIAVDGSSVPYLWDPQKNLAKPGGCFYVAWSIAATVDTSTYQKLDRKTGNVDG